MGAQDRRCNPTSNLEVLVDADLDTLAIELYVRTDDLLKAAPERAPWRPATGIGPQVSDAELVTLGWSCPAWTSPGSRPPTASSPRAESRPGLTRAVKQALGTDQSRLIEITQRRLAGS